MNPLASKLLGGTEYRQKLREQLLDAAEKTDDPAYRQRLIEIADGKRPLRTLMHDPTFLDAYGAGSPRTVEERVAEAVAQGDEPRVSPTELLEQTKEQLAEMNIPMPTKEELEALFPDVAELQQETQSVVKAEELSGWGGSKKRLEEQRGNSRD